MRRFSSWWRDNAFPIQVGSISTELAAIVGWGITYLFTGNPALGWVTVVFVATLVLDATILLLYWPQRRWVNEPTPEQATRIPLQVIEGGDR